MTNICADRVQETTTTTGTGTVTLAGASAQCQSFVAGVGNGNTCDYCILSGNGTDWETGNGPVTSGGSNTLGRPTIYASSNSGSAISLTGTSTVFLSLPASRFAGAGLFAGTMAASPIPLPTRANTGLSTWYNQGSSTVTNNAAGLTVFGPSTGSNTDNISGVYGAAPSTPYSISALITETTDWGGQLSGTTTGKNGKAAFGWTDGTKYQGFLLGVDSAHTTFTNYVRYYSDHQTFSSTQASDTNGFLMPPWWCKLRDDGTNVYFYISYDGINWYQWYSVAKASGALGSSGYANIFFGVLNDQNAVFATLMSWTQGTS